MKGEITVLEYQSILCCQEEERQLEGARGSMGQRSEALSTRRGVPVGVGVELGVRSGHEPLSCRLQPSWWDKREAAETRMPSGPETQTEAAGTSDSYGTRQEAANMYVKHVEMRTNNGAGRQILNRVWA